MNSVPFSHPFGYLLWPWLLFFTLSERLWVRSGLLFQPLHASRLQGNPSSIISMIWLRFWYHLRSFIKSRLLKTHIILRGRLAPSVHPLPFPSSSSERASAAKRSEAVAWSRLCRRHGPKTTSEAFTHRNRFLWNPGSTFVVLLEPCEPFFWFFVPWKQAQKQMNFSVEFVMVGYLQGFRSLLRKWPLGGAWVTCASVSLRASKHGNTQGLNIL